MGPFEPTAVPHVHISKFGVESLTRKVALD